MGLAGIVKTLAGIVKTRNYAFQIFIAPTKPEAANPAAIPKGCQIVAGG